MRVRLLMEYEGTNYSGWQCQKNANSVQDELERALFCVTGEDIRVCGSGRTDAGVHALGQVAHFDTQSGIAADRFAWALNSKLPRDISILKSSEVEGEFHARFSARGKHYRYVIHNARQRTAVQRNFCMHVKAPIDLFKMRAGVEYLLGTHDFLSFCAANTQIKDTVRTIKYIAIEQIGDIITMDVYGTGFLYNMVRIIAGTLIDVGVGKLNPEAVGEILQRKDRACAGATAKACGLFLAEVFYDADVVGNGAFNQTVGGRNSSSEEP